MQNRPRRAQRGAAPMNNNIIVAGSTGMVEQPQLSTELLEDYIRYLDATPATVNTYSTNLKQFAKYLSERGISHPEREDIIAYRDHLKTYCKPTTVQGYIEAIKLFFGWAEQRGLYPDIARHVKGAKVTQEHKKDYLTPKQLKKILGGIDRSTAKGMRDYALLTTMLTGGLRDVEIQRANIEDLTTEGGHCVLYVQGKGREEKADFVKIPEQTEEALRAYLKSRKADNPSEPLFTGISNHGRGQRMTTQSISRLVKGYIVQAGYDSKRLTAHSFRHSAVTLSLLSGCSLQEVQQFARHKSINTTQIYAHNIERAASKCEINIAAAVFG